MQPVVVSKLGLQVQLGIRLSNSGLVSVHKINVKVSWVDEAGAPGSKTLYSAALPGAVADPDPGANVIDLPGLKLDLSDVTLALGCSVLWIPMFLYPC